MPFDQQTIKLLQNYTNTIKETNMKTWSQVVTTGVSRDTLLDLELHDKHCQYLLDNEEEIELKETMINAKDSQYNYILISHKDPELSHTYKNVKHVPLYRKRKIPRHTSKKYPTKPVSKNIDKKHKYPSL